MTPLDYLSAALLIGGGIFFFAGTVGVLRFPDVHSRLHALTKADNLGLGFVVAGLCLHAGSPGAVAKLLLVWLLALLASAVSCYLIANAAIAAAPARDRDLEHNA